MLTVSPTFITCLGLAICPVEDISTYTNNKILRELFYNFIIMAYYLMRKKGEIQVKGCFQH